MTLWLEERVPALRYSLAALVDTPDTRFRPVLEQCVRDTRFGRALAIAGLKLVGLPLAFLAMTQLVVRPLVAGTSAPVSGRPGAGAPRAARDRDRDASFAAIVTPPRYTRVATDTLKDPVSVVALVGSDLRFVGRWTGRATMPRRPAVLRLGTGADERMIALEPRADSAPRVVLDLPVRDTVLVTAGGTMPLAATARDDLGIVSGWFEIIVSSGSAENFTFRAAALGRTPANGARDLRLGGALRLDSLDLKPGDVVHVRAVARDANPAADAESGSSETRTLRVMRPGEADSVSVEGAPPPEVGKSELSQRMLIMLTEKLVGQMRRLPRPAVSTESRSIAQEQARLRKRVGQIIFTRLTGEEPDDEDTEITAGDTLSPGEALLRAASEATGADTGHLHAEGEGGPVIGVNAPLLEAFNAMWEAERRLGVVEPREALPHMRAALAAIQKARAAERLYLRGRPPKVVLDINRIRLQGKREGVDPVARGPRASALAATRARQARFDAALALLSRGADGAAAAVDTLTMLRVDVLVGEPGLAAALGAAIEDLRAGRDATATLRAARRELTGPPERGRDARWSGSW